MQESLFPAMIDAENDAVSNGKIKITEVNSLKVRTINDATSLFDGFASMKAITWSYGLPMVVKQMRKFSDVELVFGCKAILDKQVRLSALAPLVTQAESLKSLQKKWGREISERMEKGECRLYFENTVSSHQKIYLLADEAAGRYRVITGSANFSAKAWSGDRQKEVIQVCDDKDSYFEVFEKLYKPFKNTCATEVKNLKTSLDRIDEEGTIGFGDIPVLRSKSGLLVFDKADAEDSDVVVSMTECALLGGLQQPQIKRIEHLFASSSSGFAIDQGNLTMLMLEGDKIAEEREQRDKECPRLVVDWDEGTVSTNGKQLISCGYENDAARIVEFVNNFRLFSGDVEGYQTDAWKIMVWYFATPFFSRLRRACVQARQEGLLISLPMFTFLFGSANAGKTTFMKFLAKAMCGSDIDEIAGVNFKDGDPVKNVKANTVRKPRLMQVNQKGLPVLYDDVPKGQLTDSPLRKLLTTPYARKLDMEYDGYPAVVATSNITPPMPQEFQKRALFFQASASLNQEGCIHGEGTGHLVDGIGSAFYAEYVRRAAPLFKAALDADPIGDLDVYRISSQTILGIFDDSGCNPEWVRPLCVDDYFGEAPMCQRAARDLMRYFTANRGSFERDAKKNQLIVRCSSGDRNAENVLKGIEMMLPPRFEAEFSPGMLTCRLHEIEKLCRVRFSPRDGWWRRFMG